MTKKKEAISTIILSLIGNVLLALGKGVAGVLGNSFALVADAIESTADIFSSTIVWLGLKLSTKPADEKHPYGHGKIEALSTFIVVGFLIAAAVIIAYQAILNIMTPHELPKKYTLIVLAAVIIIKELAFSFVKRKSDETNSSSLKADAWHHRSDAITSLAAFIGITIAIIMGDGYESADDWAALVASCIILYNSYLIFRPALGELLDEQLYDGLIDKIYKLSLQVEGVKKIEKCFIRKFGMTFYADIHVWVCKDITVEQGHRIAHQLANAIKNQFPEIEGVNTHIEPAE